MRYPKYLPNDGTIGFVAPSFGCATEPYRSRFDSALEQFKKWGFQTKLGPNVYAGEGIGISNTPQMCAKELTEAYLDDNSDALISCGGGELMCEILEYVDFEQIKRANPKWYMGYSDNTNFTYLLATMCDTAGIYGPCAAAFGRLPVEESVVDALEMLQGKKSTLQGYEYWEKEGFDDENPLLPYNKTEKRIIKILGEQQKVSVSGRLLGGCMDCLTTLCGTRFDHTKEFIEKYREDGVIWFLEACDLNVFSIRRAMWQMEQAGWFEHTKAFLFGRPRVGEEMMGLDEYAAVMKVAEKYHVPVICDLDIGHLPPMMPLIVGSMAQVEAFENHFSISMEEI